MGKFKEFKKENYDKKRERSLKLPTELVSHGNHSKKEETGEIVKNKEEKKTVSEARMLDDSERTETEHKHLHKVVAPVAKGISSEEKESLHDYADDSKPINMSLINHHNGHSWKEAHTDSVKNLDTALEKTTTKEDMHVYSGINWSPVQHLKNRPEGQKHVDMHLSAYTSTSTSLKKAADFASLQYPHPEDEKHDVAQNGDGHTYVRHVLKLHVPKGTHAMSMMQHSFNPPEREILLHRGHEIQIHAKPKRYIQKDGDIINVWDAHVTGHYPANLSDHN